MDTILFGGNIHTMAGRTVRALGIQNGRIAMIGSDEQLLAHQKPHTKMIDLQGKLVLPGFCDSHMHMLLTGVEAGRLDLRGVTSCEEIVARGQAYLKKTKLLPGQWVIGYGFDHNAFQEPTLPDRTVADAISTEHPVALDRVCGHVGAINTLAMERVGYDEKTVIPGGTLDQDEGGRLTGVIRETALDRIKTFFPRLTGQEVEDYLQQMGLHFAAMGLTCVHSDDLGPEGSDWDTLAAAMASLKVRGELRVRIFEEWEAPKRPQLEEILARGVYSGWGNEYLQVCNIKLITDGSLGARTAWLREPYSDDPGNRGIPVYEQAELDELVQLCHEADLQVAMHAIGDAALAQCISAVEKAMLLQPKPLRHRIVHGQIGDKKLYARMAALGMGADIQPPFIPTDAPHAPPRLSARTGESYAWKTLLDTGVYLGGGSDSPVEPPDPLWGIYCAVTRPNGQGETFLPEECLTVETAVGIYTRGGAYLAGQEKNMGTLEPGKLADLVVLDRDIFKINPEEIKSAKVLLTMLEGEISYQV